MIKRIWKGWTTSENAAAYERLLQREIFPGIREKAGEGYRGVRLLRRDVGDDEVEFCTIMTFDSLDDVREFTDPEDYQTAHVPDRARSVLKRFESSAAHYEVVEGGE